MAMISLIIEWLLHIAVLSFSILMFDLTEYGKATDTTTVGVVAVCMGEH